MKNVREKTVLRLMQAVDMDEIAARIVDTVHINTVTQHFLPISLEVQMNLINVQKR